MSLLVWAIGARSPRGPKAIVVGALGNPFNIGQTVIITGILILTALAAAIPFSARLWNVGGEGQMTVGAIAAAVLGIVLPGTWSRVAADADCHDRFDGGGRAVRRDPGLAEGPLRRQRDRYDPDAQLRRRSASRHLGHL